MEARESQDLFNLVADIIDFVPEVFNQDHWGSQLTLEMHKDSNGVEDGAVHFYDDSDMIMQTVDKGGQVSYDAACGTSCCVAGWVALLNGWHPTITEFNEGGYSETYDARRMRLEGRDGYLPNAEHKIFELEYGFVADAPGVKHEHWSWSDALMWDEGVCVLEDGVTEVTRVDIIAQKLLGLTQQEASRLFDSTQDWTGEDLRLMGKGEDILEMGKEVSANNMYGVGIGVIDTDYGDE